MTQLISKPNSKFKRVSALFLILVIGLATLTSCDNRKEALELAKTGANTAETMAKYYESLIQDTYDVWDMEAFLLQADIREGETAPTFSSTQQARLLKRVEELNKRVKLARRLASTYNALQELASYDASGEVGKSVGSLADSIKSLGVIPGAGVIPSSIFGMVAEDLTKWKQSKDIRKGSVLILQAIEKLHELFQKESEVYISIPEEKGNKIRRMVEYLIKKEKVTSLPLLQKVPESLGLKLVGADTPVKDEQTKNALIEIAKVRGQRNAQLSAMAADAIEQSLEKLANNHRKLQNKEGLSLGELKEAFERAKAYIDAINKQREENKEK